MVVLVGGYIEWVVCDKIIIICEKDGRINEFIVIVSDMI